MAAWWSHHLGVELTRAKKSPNLSLVAVVPLQDLLELSSKARFLPQTPEPCLCSRMFFLQGRWKTPVRRGQHWGPGASPRACGRHSQLAPLALLPAALGCTSVSGPLSCSLCPHRFWWDSWTGGTRTR